MQKKLFNPLSVVLAIVLLLSASCQDAPINNSAPESGKVKSETIKRSAEDAIEWAIAYKNGESSTDSRSNVTANLADIKVITTAKSRSETDTLIYVVNYDNNEGYVLVSASCHTEPILGYVEKGSFDEEKVAENSSYSYFLKAAKRYASIPKDSLIVPGTPIGKVRHVCDSILPRLEVAWNQYYPEGYFYDNSMCGCVQTATAQVMSYLEKPTSITLTYPNRDKNVETIDWSKLKQHKKSSFNCWDCPLTNEEHLVLARLCRQIGFLNNSFTGYNGDVDENGNPISIGTGVDINNVFNAFETLVPNNIVEKGFSVDGRALYDSLFRNKGVAMVGAPGHAWVCDGGKRDLWYNTFTLIGGSKEEVSGTLYLHYNWGWGGQDNGYFLSTILNPAKGAEYDEETINHNNYNFSHLNMYIILNK